MSPRKVHAHVQGKGLMVNVGETHLQNKGDNVYTEATMAAMACGIVQAVYSIVVTCTVYDIGIAFCFCIGKENRIRTLHFANDVSAMYNTLHLLLNRVPVLSMLNLHILRCEMKHIVKVQKPDFSNVLG